MGVCCTKEEKGFQSINTATDEQLRVVFDEFDLDGDNFIQEQEMNSVLSRMGHSPGKDELRAMFNAADVNKDGRIDFHEFLTIARANPLSLSLKTVFQEMDADGDGFITRHEMGEAFDKMGHQLTKDEIDSIFRQCDINQDDRINFDEFVTMMCRKQKM